MNEYRARFVAKCPSNEIEVHYELMIETTRMILVERITQTVEKHTRGYHEDIANSLFQELGGVQTLVAEHHGVTITTRRQ